MFYFTFRRSSNARKYARDIKEIEEVYLLKKTQKVCGRCFQLPRALQMNDILITKATIGALRDDGTASCFWFWVTNRRRELIVAGHPVWLIARIELMKLPFYKDTGIMDIR